MVTQKPHTEVVYMPLIPDDGGTDRRQAICSAIELNNSMTSAQPGYQRGAWGIFGSDSSKCLLTLTDWDHVSHHKDFMARPDHERLMGSLGKVSAGVDIQVFHTEMSTAEGTSITSKMHHGPVDIVRGFIPVEENHEDNNDLASKALNTTLDSKHGIAPVSYACGWSMEDLTFMSPDLTAVARPGKGRENVWVGVFGWADITTQQNARSSGAVESWTDWIVQRKGDRTIDRLTLLDYSSSPTASNLDALAAW